MYVMYPIMNLLIDFYADWIEILRHQLLKAGYTVALEEDRQNIAFKYFNIRKREIIPRPRKVLISKDLVCPLDLIPALDSFKMKAATGESLMPYQSKNILKADFNDPLLNDWGIHHFHLGIAPDIKHPDFVSRSGPLLFAKITSECIFIIQISPHGSWSNKELVEILHSNWPETLKSHKIETIYPRLAEDQIKILRKKCVQSFISLNDGTVYGLLGGGYTVSGLAMDVVAVSDKYFKIFGKLQHYVETNIEKITEKMASLKLKPSDPMELHLLINEKGMFVCERSSGFSYFLTKIPSGL